jgi:peptidoglycan hydrolase-like protein with peptidoglycan-binding domain
MKYRHLLVVSAVSLACSAAYAQDQQQHSQSDQTMSESQHSGTAMSPQMIRQVQQKLNQEGFDAGSVDGVWGPETKEALKNFQKKQGLPETGNLDKETLSALDIQMSGDGSQAQGQDSGSQAQGGQSQSGQSAGGGQSDQGAGASTGAAQGGGSQSGGAGTSQ